MGEIYVKVIGDGPYLVFGKPELCEEIIISDNDNVSIEYAKGKVFEVNSNPVALCRCGKTKNPPFCDNSHSCMDFDGTETASFEPVINNCIKYSGRYLTLFDNEKLCACARFCDAAGSVWSLIYKDDYLSTSEVKRQVNLCPSGRLILFDKDGNMLEDKLQKCITVLKDDGLGISGPLWLKGGIRVESAGGASYEIRNRQTLCRCGKSKNKPFCDCSHTHIKFIAGNHYS